MILNSYEGKTNAKTGLFRGLETLKISVTLDGVASGITSGCEITIQDANTGEIQTHIWNGEEITTTIPANHRYIIKQKLRISGYVPPSKIEYIALKDNTRIIILDNITAPIGVYIAMTDRSLIHPDDWDIENNNDVLGIYIGTSEMKRIISTNPVKGQHFSTTKSYYTTQTYYIDLDGKAHTAKIKQDPKYSSGSIVGLASSYTFKDGSEAYLPSTGEMRLVGENCYDIQKAILKIGVEWPFNFIGTRVYFWTSYKLWGEWYAVEVTAHADDGDTYSEIFEATSYTSSVYGFPMCEY